jgi:hypothetical protein
VSSRFAFHQKYSRDFYEQLAGRRALTSHTNVLTGEACRAPMTDHVAHRLSRCWMTMTLTTTAKLATASTTTALTAV